VRVLMQNSEALLGDWPRRRAVLASGLRNVQPDLVSFVEGDRDRRVRPTARSPRAGPTDLATGQARMALIKRRSAPPPRGRSSAVGPKLTAGTLDGVGGSDAGLYVAVGGLILFHPGDRGRVTLRSLYLPKPSPSAFRV
jgi:hypothetical protein